MVRAAVSGAISYADADPENKKWRIKHRLVITEIARQDKQQILERYHSHLCAYLSHSRLTDDSFEKIKMDANSAYTQIRSVIYPWLEEEKETENTAKESKIDAGTQALIDKYKAYQKRREQRNVPPG